MPLTQAFQAQAPLERLILLALIRWGERSRDKLLHRDALQRAQLGAQVRRSFPEDTARVSDTDLEAAADAVLAVAPDYRSWWRALASASGIKMEFADGEPWTPVDGIEAWEGLLDHLDGDAMVIAFLSAQVSPGADPEALVRQLDRWGVTVRAGDRSLEVLWRRGLSDLHIHVGGVRFAQLAWFDLVDGLAEAGDFPNIPRADADDYVQAAGVREKLWGLLGAPGRPEEDAPLEDDEALWWRWRSRRLIGERVLLARAWLAEAPKAELIETLDRYLSLKCRFMAKARQPADTSPGLRVFEPYFRYIVQKGVAAEELSPRLAMRSFGDALVYLGECRHLRRVELRVAPAGNAIGFGRVAQNFGKLVKAFNAERKGFEIDARLAIHFKRSRRNTDKGHLGALADLALTLSTLDRESAALRTALADEAIGPRARRWLSRVDVAGWERDTPAAQFAPYLRMARGDPEALADLNDFADDDPRAADFEHWLSLRSHGSHWPSLSEARLGLTVHAGEDFADPLDGLHQVASALEAFDMQPGDGIGHGLALTVDAAAFARDRSQYARIRRGSHLDGLIWLHYLIDQEDGLHQHAARGAKLRVEIEEQAREIYQTEVRLEDVAAVVSARRRPRSPRRPPGHGDAWWELWKLDASEEVRARQDQLISLPTLRRELVDLVPWVQQKVIDEVIRRRVVVEMNPASNWRISASGSLGLSPTVRMLEHIDQGLLASVNTDNPGTFLSRVENEYALLLAGCRSAGIPEGRARDLLERARRIGLEETWWPRPPDPDEVDPDPGEE